ncbi:MAG TPA: SDR family oxidoreductase [Chitinophagales bacterium]|nr:SDR family oxidoreductase [Chitinophagales bacterium]HRK28147.1 SDR family oxidoreductase [Chitinophagales bacterium]
MTSLYLKPFFEHDLSSLSFLITGGGGFIGSHIVEYLLLHGAKRVRAIDDFSTGFRSNVAPFLTHPAFELLEGDLRHYPTCQQACAGIDIVCHQAAIGSVPRSIQNPDYTTSVNVDGFVNIVKAAKEQGIKRVVYASSSSVYGSEPTLPKVEERIGKPLSPYAVSKYAAELYAGVFAQVYGMDFIGLRYFNVFGPRQSPKGAYAAVIPLFIDGLLRQEPVYINGNGDQTRDFTFITNVVQVNIRAMLTNNPDALNQVYNVAVGERFSVLALYQMLSEILQSNSQPVFRNSRSGDIEHSLADISKAQKLLQYHPLVSFKEGLQITVSYVSGK